MKFQFHSGSQSATPSSVDLISVLFHVARSDVVAKPTPTRCQLIPPFSSDADPSCPIPITSSMPFFFPLLLFILEEFEVSFFKKKIIGPECKTQNILVTGGAGFIGTHTVLELLGQGFHVSIIDNLDNSVEEAVDRVKDLAGPALSKNLMCHIGDLRNKNDMEKLFSETRLKWNINACQL